MIVQISRDSSRGCRLQEEIIMRTVMKGSDTFWYQNVCNPVAASLNNDENDIVDDDNSSNDEKNDNGQSW